MKIALIRHFKVNQSFPKQPLLSKSELIKWFLDYDSATDLEYKKVDLSPINYQRCYSSPMIRAVNTAKHIYGGEIIEIEELTELAILHRLPGWLKLPFIVWAVIVRLRSLGSNSCTKQFRDRVIGFVDRLTASQEGHTLVVSHWFVMEIIQVELLRRGFIGDIFKSAEYGKVYIYEHGEIKAPNYHFQSKKRIWKL